MDIRKLQEAAAELETEGASCLRAAAEIREIIKRLGVRVEPTVPQTMAHADIKPANAMSWLELGMAVLSENGGKLHMKKLLPLVWEKSGKQPARANVEGALIRGMNAGKLTRPAKGTYALAK